MPELKDTNDKQKTDRIMAVAFKEARDAFCKSIKSGKVDTNLFSKKWIAQRLKRSETFVKRNWNRDPYDVEDEARSGRPLILSQGSIKIIERNSNKKKASNAHVASEILRKRGKNIDRRLVGRYRTRMGLNPFHEIRKPKISAANKEDRLWFANYLSNWGEDDFLNLACSDEFYLYTNRKPNSKNDIIWARSIDEIPDDERFRMVGAHPQCYGVFVCFTAVKVMWVAKECGQSWDGEYFRTVLQDDLIPFLKNAENVVDPESVVFLHDKAPCMKALATQELLTDNDVDFFGNSQWPGNSPDLNPTENLGAIIKERVEQKMILRKSENINDLKRIFRSVVNELNTDTTLLQVLLKSMRNRLDEVIKASGGPTKY